MKLVLASRSPARAQMLSSAGVELDLRPANLDETAHKIEGQAQGLGPQAIAERLAAAKALAVEADAEALVIGADQTLAFEGALFDKPASLEEAASQLRRLSGHTHRLHSAAALARAGEVVWRGSQTVSLHMRALSEAFLARYLAQEGEALLGCVGAYRLEGLGAQLFERVEGDYFAVLGLPLLPLLAALRELGALPS